MVSVSKVAVLSHNYQVLMFRSRPLIKLNKATKVVTVWLPRQQRLHTKLIYVLRFLITFTSVWLLVHFDLSLVISIDLVLIRQ